MTTMTRSPPVSSRPSTLSKLLACKEARASLKEQLFALEECWRPIGQRVEQRQAEATDTHKRLRNCIRKVREIASSCAITENKIKMWRDGGAKLKKRSQDIEEQVDELFEIVEDFKEDIRGKNICLKEAEEKVKELSEINKSLLMHLSGQGELQGAESKNSARAFAEGKEKVSEA